MWPQPPVIIKQITKKDHHYVELATNSCRHGFANLAAQWGSLLTQDGPASALWNLITLSSTQHLQRDWLRSKTTADAVREPINSQPFLSHKSLHV